MGVRYTEQDSCYDDNTEVFPLYIWKANHELLCCRASHAFKLLFQALNYDLTHAGTCNLTLIISYITPVGNCATNYRFFAFIYQHRYDNISYNAPKMCFKFAVFNQKNSYTECIDCSN